MAAASWYRTDSSMRLCGGQPWRTDRNDFGQDAGSAGDRRGPCCARRGAPAARVSCEHTRSRANVSCVRSRTRGACSRCSTIRAT